MTKEEWLRNNATINDGAPVDEAFMIQLYNKIQSDEVFVESWS